MGDQDLLEILAKVLVQFVPFLFALCFHEYAHGFVAKLKGDNTAELMGRLTMNPFAHADTVGTFILPIAGLVASASGIGGGFMFGWAKPVPVSARNLKNPTKDMFWIALAGPGSNLLLAILAVTMHLLLPFLQLDPSLHRSIETLVRNFVMINILLCVFNLIPLHPLDGGKVLARFLPEKWNRVLEENESTSSILLIILFVSGGFRYLTIPMLGLYSLLYSSIGKILGLS